MTFAVTGLLIASLTGCATTPTAPRAVRIASEVAQTIALIAIDAAARSRCSSIGSGTANRRCRSNIDWDRPTNGSDPSFNFGEPSFSSAK
jgi:hypothetical protein